MLAAQDNGTQPTAKNNEVTEPPAANIPDWIKAELFEHLLKDNVSNFKKICNFKASPALAAGENYATMMLRIEIEMELQDGQLKTQSYMLKVPLESDFLNAIKENRNVFTVEHAMYHEIIPDFEQLYREAGVDVKFGAQLYTLKTPQDHILLEDLRPRGFKNINRLEGLDMEHTKCVLIKLAQWHAASAVRFETKGRYADMLTHGFLSEAQRPLLESMNNSLAKPFLTCVKTYKGHEAYLESLEKLVENATTAYFDMLKTEPNEFYVLNHGDCWSNNVMFQHDAFGKIKETYLVDHQIPQYGSPAQDLIYFLLSSTKLEIKLKQFEYFIKYYHDCLVKNLKLLKYNKKVPNLRDIHMALCKYGHWGYVTATGVMSAVLCDPTEGASMDNFMSDNEDGNNFKMLLYSNARFREHIEVILPWLHNRGAFEF